MIKYKPITIKEFKDMDQAARDEYGMNNIPLGLTYNDADKKVAYRNKLNQWETFTYDKNGKETSWKHSHGFWYECIYDKKGKRIAFMNSKGAWFYHKKRITKEEFENLLERNK